MSNNKSYKVVHYGLGPIGLNALSLALKKQQIEVVGAVDIDPEKVGKDIGLLLKGKRNYGVMVTDKIEQVLKENRPDIVVHTTQSFIPQIMPQLEEVIKKGVNIVSSSEELLFPWYQRAELAEKLDALALKHRVTVLGTGVNPGFVLDTLIICLTGICQEVRKILGRRIVDAGTRRLPLQRKIGAGLTPEQFKQKVVQKKLGHIGLIESTALIADALGWEIDDIEEAIKPKMAAQDLATEYLQVRAGQVTGIDQTTRATKNGKELIRLELQMYVGAAEPHDYVRIEGSPAVEMKITNGIAGDQATSAMLINAIPLVVEASPGLKKMSQLPLPRFWQD